MLFKGGDADLEVKLNLRDRAYKGFKSEYVHRFDEEPKKSFLISLALRKFLEARLASKSAFPPMIIRFTPPL